MPTRAEQRAQNEADDVAVYAAIVAGHRTAYMIVDTLQRAGFKRPLCRRVDRALQRLRKAGRIRLAAFRSLETLEASVRNP